MRPQRPPHRYSAIHSIQSLNQYLHEVPDTLLFVRHGGRNKLKLCANHSGKSKSRNPSSDAATMSFCTLMLSFVRDYAGSTDPNVQIAVNTIQALCEGPWPHGSVVINSQQLRDA